MTYFQKRKPILCLDFDGVIHSYTSGWKGATVIPDPPVPGAIDAMLRYVEAGFDVAIYSSRSKNPFARWAMKRWLTREIGKWWKNGGHMPTYLVEAECMGDAKSAVHYFKWPWFKPSAMVTIDDRALTFTGEWPAPGTIRQFKPWNKP